MKYVGAFIVGVSTMIIMVAIATMTVTIIGWTMEHMGWRSLTISAVVAGGLVAVAIVRFSEPPKN